MSKRVSGPPRRPRNPVAKAVRSPLYRMQVVGDKRKQWPTHKPQDKQDIQTDDAENLPKNIDDDAQE